MPLIIGEELSARDEGGKLRSRIATVFPRYGTIVTLPGIHATQRIAFVDDQNLRRSQQGLPALTEDEQDDLILEAVDLIIDEDTILIRPDPNGMALAFEADELLQEIVSKKRIKFLHVLDPRVREAIKRRGERWRISPLPRSPEEMQRMIATSRIGIGGRDIYYYNKATGTRILTFQEFNGLRDLSDPELRQHLAEIGDCCARCNRLNSPEVALFMAEDSSLAGSLRSDGLCDCDLSQVRGLYESLRVRFRESVRPEFQHDDLQSPEWRSGMYAALIGHTDKTVSEEALLGLSAEFFMQLEWLPGGRIEEGELLLDPVLEEEAGRGCGPGERVSDERARGFIFNFIRDYGDLEYVNIGRVTGSLSKHKSAGYRQVYLAEFKQRSRELPILRVLRMQKWGVREHLDEGKDLLTSILEAEEYTEYILDRRLGCRQIGMNLSPRSSARKVGERYNGRNWRYQDRWIWSSYFERDYVPGLATDKIAAGRLIDDAFSLRLAWALGRAAAPNLIVGRTDLHGHVIFDAGDELVVEDAAGLPIDIVVADHTGTFGDYRRELGDFAAAYAEPLNRRAAHLGNPRAFADAFLDAFVERFSQIQQEYRKRKRAFDTLFKHLQRDEGGSFAYRWERVLQRLDASDSRQLAERIGHHFVTR